MAGEDQGYIGGADITFLRDDHSYTTHSCGSPLASTHLMVNTVMMSYVTVAGHELVFKHFAKKNSVLFYQTQTL